MRDSSTIGPVGVAIMFGVASGILSVMSGRFLGGVLMLGCAGLISALLLARDGSARLVVVAVAAFVCTGAFAYSAAYSELTGTAVHYRLGGGRNMVAEPVTRAGSRAKFRQATSLKWGLCLLSGGMGVGVLMFRRKVETSDPFYAGGDQS